MDSKIQLVIQAVTKDAKKALGDVNKELQSIGKNGKGQGKSFGSSMKAMGKATKIAASAAIAAITAIGAALVHLGKSTQQFRTEQAKLNTAFQSMGMSADQASKTYKEIFRYLGESDTAVEAANHLAKITQNEQDLAQWTKITQGVYATFGDSLPVENLTEAANETLRVGKVTGGLADALNWAGVSEDEMNSKLAATTSFEERERILRETLNGLYSNAADIYEKNNSAILSYNESQAALDQSMASAGAAIQPMLTAVNNLGAAFFNALTPALNAIMPIITSFINAIATAVTWVAKFFNILSGGKTKTATIATGFGAAASNTKDLTNNTNGATKAAEKLKRTTAGFDELNIVSDNKSGGGSSGGGGGSPGYSTGGGGGTPIDTSGLDTALTDSETKISGFIERMKAKVTEWAALFQPSVDAWKTAFESIDWETIKTNFSDGMGSLISSGQTLGTYLLEDFIPNVTNSFSTNLVPIFGQLFSTALTEGSANFQTMAGIIDDASANIIVPALDTVKGIFKDMTTSFKDNWDKYGNPIVTNVQEAWQGIRDTVSEVYNDVIKPVFTAINDAVQEMWDEHLKPLWDELVEAYLEIKLNLLILWNRVLKPIIDWIVDKLKPVIQWVVNWVLDHIKNFVSSFRDIVGGIIRIIKGIVKFVTGVFTGDWKKAWEGIKDIFSGIFKTLGGILKLPLNAVISIINGALGGITKAVNGIIKIINKLKFTVPDWIPGIGGKEFGFNLKTVSAPTIPKLATGGIVTQSILANIGENGREAVLPLEKNTEWMDTLADKIAMRNSTPGQLFLQIDGKTLGWVTIDNINQITKQTGEIQLAI